MNTQFWSREYLQNADMNDRVILKRMLKNFFWIFSLRILTGSDFRCNILLYLTRLNPFVFSEILVYSKIRNNFQTTMKYSC
jgi:hypothetical protein